MPQIREYTNPIDHITPSDKAMNAAATLADAQGKKGYYIAQQQRQIGQDYGSAIQDVGRTLGREYETYNVKREISQGGAVSVGLQDSIAQNWRKLQSEHPDPNDDTVIASQREFVSKELEKFRGNFQTEEGRRYADQEADRITKHWNDRTIADGAVRAGQAFTQNIRTMTNRYASQTYNDPTAIDSAVQGVKSWAEAYKATAGFDAQHAAHFDAVVAEEQKKIVQTGLFRMASDNPDRFRQTITEGQYKDYVTPELTISLNNVADKAEKRLLAQQKAALTFQEQQEKRAVEGASRKIMESQSYIDEHGQMKFTDAYFRQAHDLYAMPQGAAKADHMLSYAYSMQSRKVPATDDVQIKDDFLQRIWLGSDAPNKLKLEEVQRAEMAHQLSPETARILTQAVNGNEKPDPQMTSNMRQFREFANRMKPIVSGTGIITDRQLGAQQYSTWYTAKLKEFQLGLRNGLKAEEMIMDTNSKFYLGRNNSAFLETSQKLAESLAARARGQLLPSTAPATAGEDFQNNLPGGRVYKENEFSPIDAQAAPIEKYDATKYKSVDDFVQKVLLKGGK